MNINKSEKRLKLMLSHLKQCNCANSDNDKSGILYNLLSTHILEVSLNQPKKLNSINDKMVKNLLNHVKNWVSFEYKFPKRLQDELEKLQTTVKEVPRVILMTGVGKAFCAGGDVTSLYQNKINEKENKRNQLFLNYEFVLDYFLTRMMPLQIVYWNGPVMGGGVGVSINAPIRIATEATVFAMPECVIGLYPDVGATWFLPRIFNDNTSIGLYVGLTGHKIKGKELVKCGVATHFMTNDQYKMFKESLIKAVTKNSTNEEIILLCNSFSDVVYSKKDFYFENEDFINKVFQLDSLQNIVNRLKDFELNGNEREKKLSNNILSIFAKSSPISMIVYFEQHIRGCKIKTREEAYNIESQLADVFMEDNDFYEGVRARLVEKSNDPKWEYKTINDVNQKELIAKYFESGNKENPLKFSYLDYILK